MPSRARGHGPRRQRRARSLGTDRSLITAKVARRRTSPASRRQRRGKIRELVRSDTGLPPSSMVSSLGYADRQIAISEQSEQENGREPTRRKYARTLPLPRPNPPIPSFNGLVQRRRGNMERNEDRRSEFEGEREDLIRRAAAGVYARVHAERPRVARRFSRPPVVLAFYPADLEPGLRRIRCRLQPDPADVREYDAAVLASRSTASGVTRHLPTRGACASRCSRFEPKGEVARRYGAYDREHGVAQRRCS